MKLFTIEYKREVTTIVSIEADTKEDALALWENGDYDWETEHDTDSTIGGSPKIIKEEEI